MPDAAMMGVSDGQREALRIIARGGAMRDDRQRHYWSLHGNLDLRNIRGLLKRELVRERRVDEQPKDGQLVELYLTESGRYVLAYPERLQPTQQLEREAPDAHTSITDSGRTSSPG